MAGKVRKGAAGATNSAFRALRDQACLPGRQRVGLAGEIENALAGEDDQENLDLIVDVGGDTRAAVEVEQVDIQVRAGGGPCDARRGRCGQKAVQVGKGEARRGLTLGIRGKALRAARGRRGRNGGWALGPRGAVDGPIDQGVGAAVRLARDVLDAK